jgi:hypothetical protein
MATRKAPSTPRRDRTPNVPSVKPARPLLEVLDDIARMISDEDRAGFPRDGARNAHHYLYGAPRQDAV